MRVISQGGEYLDNENPSAQEDRYYRIGELAREFGVTHRALRFYEDKQLIHPERRGVTRLYSRRDRIRLNLVLYCKKIGFSLREIKQILDLYEPGGRNIRQTKVMLEKSTRHLERLKAERASIEEAIAELNNLVEIMKTRLADQAAGDKSA